jgi:hypothetical protein
MENFIAVTESLSLSDDDRVNLAFINPRHVALAKEVKAGYELYGPNGNLLLDSFRG